MQKSVIKKYNSVATITITRAPDEENRVGVLPNNSQHRSRM
jgi:hypothetical protein